MSFNPNFFDARLILAQILCVQCLSYLSLSLQLWLLHEVLATPFSLNEIFDYRTVGWDNLLGAAAVAANGLFVGVQLSVVVERSKKCLDFASTVFFLHLVACSRLEGFPLNWMWWAVNLIAVALAAALGEYLCMKKELKEINVNEFLSVSSLKSDWRLNNNGRDTKNLCSKCKPYIEYTCIQRFSKIQQRKALYYAHHCVVEEIARGEVSD